jgi:GNAT superfamily N-acetyltransferase
VFVACVGDAVVGWVDVAITLRLQSQPFALIGGLVVKEGLRGQRIGKRLCEEAEAWSRAQGVGVIRVTSRSTREDAHRFYLRNGYTDVKTSRVFEKKLS